MFLRFAPIQRQWRLSWGRPAPVLRGFQEAPPVLIAEKSSRAGRRDSGHGKPRLDVECISFEAREERNPARATESTEKGGRRHRNLGGILARGAGRDPRHQHVLPEQWDSGSENGAETALLL